MRLRNLPLDVEGMAAKYTVARYLCVRICSTLQAVTSACAIVESASESKTMKADQHNLARSLLVRRVLFGNPNCPSFCREQRQTKD
jgi:hypothetical protein